MANPELLVEPDDDLQVEPEPVMEVEPAAPVTALAPLMEVLPADFPLPLLIRFVPDQQLHLAVDQAATYALSVKVDGPEGLRLADTAINAVKTAMKAIEEHFAEPCEIANRLHKSLTGRRSEWLAGGATAVQTVGNRIWQEKRRLDALEAAERRKRQEEEDRKLREQLRAEAEAAAKQQAPAPVVEEMKRQAETATAPPVSTASVTSTALKGSSTVTTWKCRIAGTPASDEPNPEIEELSVPQRAKVLELLRAIVDGKAPIAAVALNWSYLNKRAKADKGTFAIAGLEAYEDGGIRAKGTRAR